MESNVLSEAAGGLYRDKAAFYAPEEVMGLPLPLCSWCNNTLHTTWIQAIQITEVRRSI
jgi:hypothetical protein